jgi:hypothetical protein
LVAAILFVIVVLNFLLDFSIVFVVLGALHLLVVLVFLLLHLLHIMLVMARTLILTAGGQLIRIYFNQQSNGSREKLK